MMLIAMDGIKCYGFHDPPAIVAAPATAVNWRFVLELTRL